MSTRATYQIGDQVFYIHHDGYPAGAASYFANMIGALTVSSKGRGIGAIADRRGGALFAFIRGNMNVEPTESHDVHGDTEFRWRILGDEGALHVSRQKRTSFDGYAWSAWSKPEPIEQFVNAHYPGATVAIEDPSPYYKRTRYATIANAIEIAAEERRQEARFADGNPNKATHRVNAEAWERALLEQLPKRASWLEKERAEAQEEIKKGGFWAEHYGERLEEIAAELEKLRVPIGELEIA